MNRKIIFSVLVVLATILTACGGSKPTSAPGSAPAGAVPQKGGAIIVAYKDDLATLDPAIGYDWTNWPAEKLVFDGLLDYDSTTTIVPRLAAAMPTINSDATAYTFKLLKGVK